MLRGVAAISEGVLINHFMNGGGHALARSRTSMGLYLIASFMVCLGAGFLIYAGFQWASTQYTPEQAATLTGLSILFLAVCTALGAQIVIRKRRNKLEQIKHEVTDNLQELLSSLDDDWGGVVSRNPKTSMLVAAVAGYVLGDRLL